MEVDYSALAERITSLAADHGHNTRYLVGVGGGPGSGKTTLATGLAAHINQQRQHSQSLGDGEQSPPPEREKPKAMVLSMDGFHLPRSTLDSFPEGKRQEAYIRRGAPWTFDVLAFKAFMKRLRNWADSGQFGEGMKAPTFSHAAKDPVEDGVTVSSDTSIVIIEGNYVLLDQDEWRDVSALVDYRVFVDVELDEARERLARRHVEVGIEPTLEMGYKRVDANDYPNGVLIREKRVRVDEAVYSNRF